MFVECTIDASSCTSSRLGSRTGTPRLARRLTSTILTWVPVLIIAAVVLFVFGYHSRSGDSNFYNGLVVQIHDQPIRHWIAPRWGENRYSQPPDKYIHDHLAGNLMLGAVVAGLGVPAEHALTIVQWICQILALYLLVALAQLFLPPSRAASTTVLLWGMQLIPASISHGIRANHEQSVLLFMLVAIYGAVRMRDR